MSRGWKVAIGVVVAVVVVAAIALPIVGIAIFRGRVRGQVWAPEMLHRWESGEAPHKEVELVDEKEMVSYQMRCVFKPQI